MSVKSVVKDTYVSWSGFAKLSSALVGLFLLYLVWLQASDPEAFKKKFLEGLLGLRQVSVTFSRGGSGSLPGLGGDRPKIGFHTGMAGNLDGFDYYTNSLTEACIPVTIKSADNAGPIFEAQERMKATGCPGVLVFRSDRGPNHLCGDDQTAGVPDYSLSPKDAAVKHWGCHMEMWPPELDPSMVWIETVNEIDKERSEWMAEFAIETAHLAWNDGFKWAAFAWSSGEPEPEHWRGPKMLEFLRLAGENRDRLAIAVHEYSFTTSSVQDATPHMIGRYKDIFAVAKEHGFPRPSILITEWGWEYNHIPEPDVALEHINWTNGTIYTEDEVLGAFIWYLGGYFGNIHDETNRLIVPVTDWALSYGHTEESQPDEEETPAEAADVSRLPLPPQRKLLRTSLQTDDVDLSMFPGHVIAKQAEAANWATGFGADVDIGMMLALIEGETNVGRNLGSCSGMADSMNISFENHIAATMLLSHWREHRVRDWSPVAAQLITEDYTDFIAHCGAGAHGPDGILPLTGLQICSAEGGAFANSGDPEIASCNFFDIRVSAYAKAWWLNAIHYRASSSDAEKFEALYGWNRDVAFRNWLIARATEINAAIGEIPPDDGGSGDDDSGGYVFEVRLFWVHPSTYLWSLDAWWYVIRALQFMDLVPKLIISEERLQQIIASGGSTDEGGDSDDELPPPPPTGGNCADGELPLITGWTNPHPGDYYTTSYHGPTHPGVDFGTHGVSTPILASHNGCVTYVGWVDYYTDPLTLLWNVTGNTIAIKGKDEDGNVWTTVYGHGAEDQANPTWTVQVGDVVNAGDHMMMSGLSGNNPHITGLHLHFDVFENDEWRDPCQYVDCPVR